jgi:hypothetical protein
MHKKAAGVGNEGGDRERKEEEGRSRLADNTLTSLLRVGRECSLP